MSAPIDFEALFDIAPNAYMVLDRELRYVAANSAYLAATASRRDELLGRHVFERFPNDPGDPNNRPALMLRASLESVLETGKPDHLAYIPYRVPKNVDGRIVDEERVWSATHRPILDGDGKVAFILQHTVDVSELPAVESTGASLRDGAGVLERARAVQEEKEVLAAEREQLRVLFEQAPGFMCFLEGAEHRFQLANNAYRELVGKRDALVGRTVREALPEVVEQGFITILDRVFQTGEPYLGLGIEVLLQRVPEAPAEKLVVDFVYQPVLGRDGRPAGIFVQGHDVTLRRRAEEESEAARRAAEAFSAELQAQSIEVAAALEASKRRIAELEAQLAAR